jgi:hypothetical protein
VKLLYVFATDGEGGGEGEQVGVVNLHTHPTPTPPPPTQLQLWEGGTLEGVGPGTYVHKITDGACT